MVLFCVAANLRMEEQVAREIPVEDVKALTFLSLSFAATVR